MPSVSSQKIISLSRLVVNQLDHKDMRFGDRQIISIQAKLLLTYSQSEVQVTTWTCNWVSRDVVGEGSLMELSP